VSKVRFNKAFEDPASQHDPNQSLDHSENDALALHIKPANTKTIKVLPINANAIKRMI
jgi:hypothetical protein